jgi:hypothetical protein
MHRLLRWATLIEILDEAGFVWMSHEIYEDIFYDAPFKHFSFLASEDYGSELN